MQGQETKELRVNPNEDAKRIIYLAKEFLLNTDVINIVSGTNGAPLAARACETLSRLGYITYEGIKTETNIVNDSRRTRLVITIRKTKNFKTLYDENEANRKKFQETTNTGNQDKNSKSEKTGNQEKTTQGNK
jgi:hypothetical protein